MKLSNMRTILPGFKAAVNVQDDWNDRIKLASYIPTAFVRNLLAEIASSIAADSKTRAHLVYGAYGVGKSHMALAVGHYLGEGWHRGWWSPILSRIMQTDSQLALRLGSARQELGSPMLIVHVHGSDGPTRECLLRCLNRALEREHLAELMPTTAFHAAIERVDYVKSHHPEAVPDMERELLRVGYSSAAALVTELHRFRQEALVAFIQAHPSFSRGAAFDPHGSQKPQDIYRAVAAELQRQPPERRMSGILTIWDEFGLHLDSVLQDSAYIDLQAFAEACSASGPAHLHFLALAHRSIEQTVTDVFELSPAHRELLNRMAGRFQQRRVTAQSGEQYRLVAQAIMTSNKDHWADFKDRHQDWVAALVDESQRRSLFPGMSADEVRDIVVLGAYPLHPAATLALTALSEKVAQNERTLFHFLSESGPDAMPAYLVGTELTTVGPPPALTVDRLYPFFEEVTSQSRRPGVREVWVRYQRLSQPEDDSARQVLKTVLLLQVINLPQLRPTSDGVAFSLGSGTSGQRHVIDAALEGLCNQKLLRRLANQEYDFRSAAAEVDVEEAMENALKGLPPRPELAPVLGRWAGRAELPTEVPATDHNQRYAHNRTCVVQWVGVDQFQGTPYKEQGAPRDQDGVLYFVAATTAALQRAAAESALQIVNPRVLTVVPSRALPIEGLVRRFLALQQLEIRLSEVFGPGGRQREDWESELQVIESEAVMHLRRLFHPGEFGPTLYWAGTQRTLTEPRALSEAVSLAMDTAYPKTIRIPHSKLLETSSRDTQKSYRVAVIDTLLQGSIEALVEQKVEPVKFIIQAVLCETGWLRQENSGWVLGRPDPTKYRNSAEAYELIEHYIREATKTPRTFLRLVDDLTQPPFGLRHRTIPLLLAAVVKNLQASLVLMEGSRLSEPSGLLLERLIKDPQSVHVLFSALTQQQRWLLEAVSKAFGPMSCERHKAPLAQAKSVASTWFGGLPGLARTSRRVTAAALAVRDRVLSVVASTSDDDTSRRVMFEVLPQLCGVPNLSTASYGVIGDRVSSVLGMVKHELEGHLSNTVLPVLADLFSASQNDKDAVGRAIGEFAGDIKLIDRRQLTPDETAFCDAVNVAAQDLAKGMTELASAASSVSLDAWRDEDLAMFQGAARTLIAGLRGKMGPQTSDYHPSLGESASPGPTKTAISRPQLRQAADFVAVSTDQGLADKRSAYSVKPVASTPRQASHPVAVRDPDSLTRPPMQIRIWLGGHECTLPVGNLLSPAARNTLAAIKTAIRRPGLSRQERQQVLCEALAELILKRDAE